MINFSALKLNFMKTKKNIIDSIYLNSEGGKAILFQIIEYIINNKMIEDYVFLIDNRISNKEIKLDISNFLLMQPSEIARKKYYKKNKNNINSITCLSNVPPPINLGVNVNIYFHNTLLLRPLISPLSIKNKILNLIKKLYIRYLNNANYIWVVQTEIMKKKLSSTYRINTDKIITFPIFDSKKNNLELKKRKNSFLYVSNISSHKNHDKLLYAFIDSAEKTQQDLELNLTIPEIQYSRSIYTRVKIPENLKIVNHGVLSKKKLYEIYNKSTFLIFPSLDESFGLPLIESINNNCNVISSNMPYVYQIIRPSLTFDPHSIKSISKTIISALQNDNVKQSKILVENKIDTFVKYISTNVKK